MGLAVMFILYLILAQSYFKMVGNINSSEAFVFREKIYKCDEVKKGFYVKGE